MTWRLYQEGDTFLHRLNPVIKLAAFSFLLLVPTLFLDPATPGAFLILSWLVGWGLGRISPLDQARRLIPFLAAACGLALSNTFFYGGPRVHLLFTLGPLRIWREAASLGASIGLRILCLASYSAIFVRTTDPTSLAMSLVHQAHIPYRVSYAILAAYRFLPILRRELANIRDAHKVRRSYEGEGLREWFTRARRYGLPLLANGIRQAERLAVAMDARAFGALSTRTYYVRTPVVARDYAFLAGSVLMGCVLLLILAQHGLLQGFLAGAAESIIGARSAKP